MIDDRQQLALFASFESPSTSTSPSSLRSSAHATSSSDTSTVPPISATKPASTRPVTARSSRAGAGSADSSSSVVKPTAAVVQQPLLPISIARKHTEKPSSIPRPTTLGQCSEEARPCPWVSCKHHLLLEVTLAKVRLWGDTRATMLRLNTARPRQSNGGRRPGLSSSAAEAIVRTWMDDALDALVAMPYSCTFDVVAAYPDGAPVAVVAQLLGVREQLIDVETRVAQATLRQRMADHESGT